MFNYDEWISEQTETVASTVNRLAMSGIYDAGVYVFPSVGKQQGFLVISTEQPQGAVDVVRFPAVGSRVSAVPRPQLWDRLWHACRRMPICPTE